MSEQKPDISEVLELMRMKKTAGDLYDEFDKRVAALAAEFGEGRFDYDLNTVEVPAMQAVVDVKDGRFLKFELFDNVAKLAAGEDVWKSVAFKPQTYATRQLKGKPVSLK